MATIATLVAKLVGDIEPFQRSMKQAETESKGFGSRISGAMNGALGTIGSVAKIAGGAAVAGFAALGTAAFAAGMDIDSAYDAIIIKTGAIGPELDKLKSDFDAVFTSIPTSAELAGNTLAEFSRRLNLTGAPLQDLTKNMLEMTRLLGGDAVTSAENFSRVIGDWSIPTEQASKSLNELFVVSQKTGVGTDKLMEQVVQFGSPMRLMGFSFRDTAALLAKWEKEGVNAELVMGSLRIAAGKFAKEGKPLRDSLLETFNSIKKNKDATAALAQGMQIFGARAGPDMVAAIREGRFATEDLVAAMGDAQNAIGDAASATEDFPEKFAVMKNKVASALAPLGMLIMDVIGGAMDAVGPIVQEFGVWFTANMPQIRAVVEAVFTWIQTNVGPILNNVIAGFQAIFAWVQQNWPAIQSAIETAWNNIVAVVGPAVEAIGSLIQSVFGAIATFLQTHGEDIKNFIGETWATIRSIVEPVIKWFYETITVVFGGIATWISDNQAEIQRIFEGVWNGIKMFVGVVLDAIRGVVKAVLALLHGDVQGALDALGEMFRNIWDRIKVTVAQAVETVRMILLIAWAKIKEGVENVWNGIRTWIETAWENIMNFFRTLPDKLFELGKQIIEGLWNGIKSMFADIGKGISDFFQNTIDDIRKKLGIQSPSTVMVDVGMALMSGLALGIRNGTDLPQVALDKAMSGITSPALALAAPAAAGGGTTISNNWNVTTDQSGMALLLERQRQMMIAQFEDRM